jgi:hypothetical protein
VIHPLKPLRDVCHSFTQARHVGDCVPRAVLPLAPLPAQGSDEAHHARRGDLGLRPHLIRPLYCGCTARPASPSVLAPAGAPAHQATRQRAPRTRAAVAAAVASPSQGTRRRITPGAPRPDDLAVGSLRPGLPAVKGQASGVVRTSGTAGT